MAVCDYYSIIFHQYYFLRWKMKPKSLIEFFSQVPDPRVNRTRKHNLIDIIVMTICGLICKSETWTDIADYADANEEWFRQFLELPGGVPSHDTFGRVFSLIDPLEFQKAFYEWTQSVAAISEGEIIALDGKYNTSSLTIPGQPRSITGMVSAWASTSGVALAALKTDFYKEGEKKIYKNLLDFLNIKGCIVTIDAYGCHSDITDKIIEKGGDFVISLKKNQRILHDEVEDFFNSDIDIEEVFETNEIAHGRKEKRVCKSAFFDPTWIDCHREAKKRLHDWKGIVSVIEIKSERTINGKTSAQTRYYISSLLPDAEKMLNIVRSHWGIENKLHYALDVSFDEDHSRVRTGYAAENFSTARRLALNLVRKEPSLNRSVNRKRLMCLWKNEYLLKVIKGMTPDDFI
jgi:predicted transposase YbfD/YdcC